MPYKIKPPPKINKNNKEKKKANHGGGRKSDFQRYHIRFKCPMFNKKIKRNRKKQESMAHSKEKKTKSTATAPEKDLMADLPDKDFKITPVKILKELKEDVEKVKKNSVNKMEILIKKYKT